MKTIPVSKPISVSERPRSDFKNGAKLDMNCRSTKFITFSKVTNIKKLLLLKLIIYPLDIMNLFYS